MFEGDHAIKPLRINMKTCFFYWEKTYDHLDVWMISQNIGNGCNVYGWGFGNRDVFMERYIDAKNVRHIMVQNLDVGMISLSIYNYLIDDR